MGNEYYKNIVINGEFLERRITGQERFAREVVAKIDSQLEKTNLSICLAVPKHVTDIPSYENIEVIKIGHMKGLLWEQTSLAFYALKNKAYVLSLCSIAPLFAKGAICIHDICYKDRPEYFKTVYARLSMIWHRLQFQYAKRRADIIYTVSEYSKGRICSVYNVDDSKVTVLRNGWEHILRIKPDSSILKKNTFLIRGDYFYSLGSLAPNKNFDWVIKTAQKNKNATFVIAGSLNEVAYKNIFSSEIPSNVYLIGYVTDEENVALMQGCKAFILPTLYEGFGIPPLEALALGAEVIVSNATCLPEIFGKSVHYIDPKVPLDDINQILSDNVSGRQQVLDKYKYEKSAEILINDFKKLPLI